MLAYKASRHCCVMPLCFQARSQVGSPKLEGDSFPGCFAFQLLLQDEEPHVRRSQRPPPQHGGPCKKQKQNGALWELAGLRFLMAQGEHLPRVFALGSLVNTVANVLALGGQVLCFLCHFLAASDDGSWYRTRHLRQKKRTAVVLKTQSISTQLGPGATARDSRTSLLLQAVMLACACSRHVTRTSRPASPKKSNPDELLSSRTRKLPKDAS